jgi:hypothetical protein
MTEDHGEARQAEQDSHDDDEDLHSSLLSSVTFVPAFDKLVERVHVDHDLAGAVMA